MTIKEKLYREFVIAKNKLNALKGEALIGGDNIEEYFNSYDFSNRASHHTKEEIKNMIDYAKRCYETEVERQRTEDYFETEEGKARKESLESEIESLRNEVNTRKSEMQKTMNDTIKVWLGADWGVHVFNGSMEIGIINKVNEEGYFDFHFCGYFNVYFSDYVCDGGKFRFDVNYGTTGAFNPFENDIHRRFVVGMGKFLADIEKMNEIKHLTHEYVYQLQKLASKIYDLETELKNPFNKVV